ncbi:TPA: hypothetical protein DEP96_01890 [Candidatus Uhrbacteria bacterium]|nr:hypothetical protein [Candidatus Uhrbacteria bacterium]
MNDTRREIVHVSFLKEWLEIARKMLGQPIEVQKGLVARALRRNDHAERPSAIIRELTEQLKHHHLMAEHLGSSAKEFDKIARQADVEYLRAELAKAYEYDAEEHGSSWLAVVRGLMQQLEIRPEEIGTTRDKLDADVASARLTRDRYLLKQARQMPDPRTYVRQIISRPEALGSSAKEFAQLSEMTNACWHLKMFRIALGRGREIDAKSHARVLFVILIEHDVDPERIGTTYEEFEKYV